MSNENHNSKPAWKSKLEELESLPGEVMPDKNISWEKIHARLQGRKTPKNPLWYWLSAASVLFFLILVLFISNKKSEQLPNIALQQMQSETKQGQSEKAAPGKTKNHNKNSFAVEDAVFLKKNRTAIFNKPEETAHTNIMGNKKDELRLYDTVSAEYQIAEITNKSLQAIDTPSNISVIIPAKKRLPVVHINELGEPDHTPQMARNLEKPTLHFLTLGSGKVYNGSAPVTKNFTKINFKTSPN